MFQVCGLNPILWNVYRTSVIICPNLMLTSMDPLCKDLIFYLKVGQSTVWQKKKLHPAMKYTHIGIYLYLSWWNITQRPSPLVCWTLADTNGHKCKVCCVINPYIIYIYIFSLHTKRRIIIFPWNYPITHSVFMVMFFFIFRALYTV